MDILKPPALTKGDTVGIFAPSHPAYVFSEEKFLLGIKVIEELGYKVKLGTLTNDRSVEGYRLGPERAVQKSLCLYIKILKLNYIRVVRAIDT